MIATRSPINPIRHKSAYALACLFTTAFLALIAGSAKALPADRAYEMVSPVDKNGADVGAGAGLPAPYVASADGEAIAYNAQGGWGDAPTNGLNGAYMARRMETEWSNTSLLLPVLPRPVIYNPGVAAVSNDFSRAVVVTNLDPDTGEPNMNFGGGYPYLLDSVTKAHERIAGQNLSGGPFGTYLIQPEDFHGSDDFSTLYYSPFGAHFTPEAAASGNARLVYRYEDGEIEAINENVNGDLQTASLPDRGRPVSADGSIVHYNMGALLRRDFSQSDDPPAVVVNASENTLEAVPQGSATFVSASTDGLIAYFISDQRLVDEDTDNSTDLYRWQADQSVGSRLTLISTDGEPADGTGGAAASLGATVSPDGSRVYFAHSSQLVPDASTDAGTKLYVWDEEDGIRYLGIAGDTTAVTGPNVDDTYSVMSENGEFLGIATTDDLTGDNDTGLGQVYLYDYAADSLSCVSCRPGGGENTAPSIWRVAPNTTMLRPNFVPSRNVSDQGHVFFQTAEALLPQDTNRRQDVYVWEDGELDLISTGRSDDHSLFGDASADGEDVFFVTRSQLVGWDTDTRVDLYDARVGDGLPEPTPEEPPCQGDDCQGEGPPSPSIQGPSSSTYQGEGNPARGDQPRDCRKLERKGKRLQRKAKQLTKKAKKADGKRAKGLRQKAKKAKRQAKKAGREANRCNRGRQS